MYNIKSYLYNMTMVSLFTSLMCASSFVVLPVPFTPVVLSVHTIVVNLAALLMYPKHSFCTMALYLVMGFIGLPVFSGGTAGPDKLFGLTGGYYFGFLVSAILVSILKGKNPGFKRYLALTLFVSIPVQHLFAVAFMCFHNGFNVMAAFVSVSLPFVVPDVIKAFLSATVALKLSKVLGKN